MQNLTQIDHSLRALDALCDKYVPRLNPVCQVLFDWGVRTASSCSVEYEGPPNKDVYQMISQDQVDIESEKWFARGQVSAKGCIW